MSVPAIETPGPRTPTVPSALPYVAPFVTFVVLMAVLPRLGVPPLADQVLRIALPVLALLVFSRGVLDFRVARPLASTGVGLLVFVIWVAPDMIWPHYRDHWLFQNDLLGRVQSSYPEALRDDVWGLLLRTLRATIVVAIIEELFWRGWLMRWLVRKDYQTVPLGTYAPAAFWLTALLFASEHGPFWDVGLLAGLIYNYWLIRTRRLGDCILAHAVTNGCLSAFVITTGQWRYWM